jgi:hypothetical protein
MRPLVVDPGNPVDRLTPKAEGGSVDRLPRVVLCL